MKVYFFTLGCKVNQYETQEMEELFEKAGYTITYNLQELDIAVVNSCTVTAESVRKTRQIIRKIRKQRPNSIIILTGCASQAEPQIANDLPEVNIFMGNRSNPQIIDTLNKYLDNPHFINNFIEHKNDEPFIGTGITHFNEHTRAFLKIQDGCDRFCSYCLIPMARGRSRSKPLEDIDVELQNLAKAGYKEVVFVGINLSDYGRKTNCSLPDALMLAEKYDGIERVRLGSLEPDHITNEMIAKLKKITKLCPQFHISVQSGCDSVLKAMNRHYTAEDYENLANSLRENFTNATITTDILTGFPTETEDNFNTTINFVKRVGFEKIHVFPYSVRQGTVAAKMPQLTKAIKENRAAKLSKIATDIREEFLKNQIGKTVNVLFEMHKSGYSEGYTENYTPVKVLTDNDFRGQIKTVKITDVSNGTCIGVIK